MKADEIVQAVMKLSPQQGDVLIVRLSDAAIASGQVDFESLGKMFKAIPELATIPVTMLGESTNVTLDRPRALALIQDFRQEAREARAKGTDGAETAAKVWLDAAQRVLQGLQDAPLQTDNEETSRLILPP